LTDLPLVLRDLSIVLAIATAVALLFGRLHLSVVAAFLVAGAILGPTGAGLVAESGMVDALAEIGVALLLFTVGLEISLANLGKMRLRILQGGGSSSRRRSCSPWLSFHSRGFPSWKRPSSGSSCPFRAPRSC
jgi:Kef-type K+ transport system membrane component KefB